MNNLTIELEHESYYNNIEVIFKEHNNTGRYYLYYADTTKYDFIIFKYKGKKTKVVFTGSELINLKYSQHTLLSYARYEGN